MLASLGTHLADSPNARLGSAPCSPWHPPRGFPQCYPFCGRPVSRHPPASTAPTRHSCTGSPPDRAGDQIRKSGIWLLLFRPVKTATLPSFFADFFRVFPSGSAPGAVRGGARLGRRGRGGRDGGARGSKSDKLESTLAANGSAPKQGPLFLVGRIPGPARVPALLRAPTFPCLGVALIRFRRRPGREQKGIRSDRCNGMLACLPICQSGSPSALTRGAGEVDPRPGPGAIFDGEVLAMRKWRPQIF